MKKEEFEKIINTPGIMMHATGITTDPNSSCYNLEKDLSKIENIMNEGILPIKEQLKRYGKVSVGEGSDLQGILGAFNYVSVYDPYLGRGAKPEDRNLEKYLDIKKNFRELAFKENEGKFGKRDFNEMIYSLFTIINYNSRYEGIQFNLDASLKEEYIDFFENLNQEMENQFKRKNKNLKKEKKEIILYKRYYKKEGIEDRTFKINLPKYFEGGLSRRDDIGIGFFLNPDLERAAAVPSVYDFESFIKGNISYEDIFTVALKDNFKDKKMKKEISDKLDNICREKNIPFYVYESDEKTHTVNARTRI